jgi:hypothetical protein
MCSCPPWQNNGTGLSEESTWQEQQSMAVVFGSYLSVFDIGERISNLVVF